MALFREKYDFSTLKAMMIYSAIHDNEYVLCTKFIYVSNMEKFCNSKFPDYKMAT